MKPLAMRPNELREWTEEATTIFRKWKTQQLRPGDIVWIREGHLLEPVSNPPRYPRPRRSPDRTHHFWYRRNLNRYGVQYRRANQMPAWACRQWARVLYVGDTGRSGTVITLERIDRPEGV